MKQSNLYLDERYYDRDLEVPCIKVEQPIGTFYVGSIDSKSLCEITTSDVRRMEGERGFETYLGIQRPLKKDRVAEISEYVNTQDACFPTAVLLSVPARCAVYDPIEKTIKLKPYKAIEGDSFESIPYYEIAHVIDGQHRIAGLKNYKGEKFEVNVSIFVDIDVSSEAQIFSIVNLAQTKVHKSLVYDLFDLAKKRSPQKLCHEISVTLDKENGSPFKNRIKRLGAAEAHNLPGSITQAAFVESLMKYISANPMKDRDQYLRGRKPIAADADPGKQFLRKFLVEERDYELTDILWNYFSAVQQRWPLAWSSSDRGIILSKTNGFMALMRFLKDVYFRLSKDVPSQEDFYEVFSKIDLQDSDFNTELYKPGSSGESALYKDLSAGRRLF